MASGPLLRGLLWTGQGWKRGLIRRVVQTEQDTSLSWRRRFDAGRGDYDGNYADRNSQY
jgi:hypothetical protein